MSLPPDWENMWSLQCKGETLRIGKGLTGRVTQVTWWTHPTIFVSEKIRAISRVRRSVFRKDVFSDSYYLVDC